MQIWISFDCDWPLSSTVGTPGYVINLMIIWLFHPAEIFVPTYSIRVEVLPLVAEKVWFPSY